MNMCIPALYRISYRLVGRAYIGSLVTNDWHDGITRYRHPSRPASASRVHRRKPLSPLHGRQRRDRRGRRSRRRRADRGRTRRGRPRRRALAAIWLRGYLVPGTPELTKRYLPGRALRLFGKGRDAGPPAEVDAESYLLSAEVLVETPDGSDLAFAPWFESAWRTHLAALRDAADAEFGASSVPGEAVGAAETAPDGTCPASPRRHRRPRAARRRRRGRALAAVARRSGIRARRQRANRSLGVPIGVPRGCRRRPRVNGASRRLGVAPARLPERRARCAPAVRRAVPDL